MTLQSHNNLAGQRTRMHTGTAHLPSSHSIFVPENATRRQRQASVAHDAGTLHTACTARSRNHSCINYYNTVLFGVIGCPPSHYLSHPKPICAISFNSAPDARQAADFWLANSSTSSRDAFPHRQLWTSCFGRQRQRLSCLYATRKEESSHYVVTASFVWLQ